MKKLKLTPAIKFNGGNPVAICNHCAVIMCYVSCTEKDPKYGIVIRHNPNRVGGFYTTSPIGQTPPLYCDTCAKTQSK